MLFESIILIKIIKWPTKKKYSRLIHKKIENQFAENIQKTNSQINIEINSQQLCYRFTKIVLLFKINKMGKKY